MMNAFILISVFQRKIDISLIIFCWTCFSPQKRRYCFWPSISFRVKFCVVIFFPAHVDCNGSFQQIYSYLVTNCINFEHSIQCVVIALFVAWINHNLVFFLIIFRSNKQREGEKAQKTWNVHQNRNFRERRRVTKAFFITALCSCHTRPQRTRRCNTTS